MLYDDVLTTFVEFRAASRQQRENSTFCAAL
jgi:hypothetical protein